MNTLMWLEKSVDKQDITINQLATFASSKTKYGVRVYCCMLAGVRGSVGVTVCCNVRRTSGCLCSAVSGLAPKVPLLQGGELREADLSCLHCA